MNNTLTKHESELQQWAWEVYKKSGECSQHRQTAVSSVTTFNTAPVMLPHSTQPQCPKHQGFFDRSDDTPHNPRHKSTTWKTPEMRLDSITTTPTRRNVHKTLNNCPSLDSPNQDQTPHFRVLIVMELQRHSSRATAQSRLAA